MVNRKKLVKVIASVGVAAIVLAALLPMFAAF